MLEGRSSDHEQAGQRQDQGGGGGEGGASREPEGAGGGGFQEVESRMQGPEDEGMKWSRTRIGVWQLEVSGGLWREDGWRTAKETRPGTLRRGGGRRLTWTGLVSQKPGRREMVRMETGAESKEGMFLPGEAGVTGL